MTNNSNWKQWLISVTPIIFFFLFITTDSFSQIVIKGTVLDGEFGGGLPGANIKIKGETNTISTDLEGHYSISVKDSNSILIFSSIGFICQEIKVGNNCQIDLTLKKKVVQIDDYIKDRKTGQSYNDVTGKPIIYLYPSKETNINVKIKYAGILQTTYPLYNNGWKVKASPNGDIINLTDNKEYSYLFWDGLTDYSESQLTYDNGFVIASDSALHFLQNVLPTMGLKPKEFNEFIVYWLPFLQANRLNFIHFRTGEDYDIISKNEVNPKPDSQIRIFIEFKAVDSMFKVKPQIFKSLPRQGFTLVEWGGSLLKKPIKVRNEKGEYITR